MNKKKTTIIVLFVALIVFLTWFTTSYVIKSTRTDNVITFGKIKLKLIEKELVNGNLVDVENNSKLTLNSDKISRRIKVKNICNHPFYTRVKISILNVYDNTYDYSNLISYDVSPNWVYKDGWYYYKKRLEKNESTDNIIEEIKFMISDISNNYKNNEFKLNVKAEAVQSENNNDNFLEAVGWPSK